MQCKPKYPELILNGEFDDGGLEASGDLRATVRFRI
jgi:hypothetical protein